jgi:hypothetical protein
MNAGHGFGAPRVDGSDARVRVGLRERGVRRAVSVTSSVYLPRPVRKRASSRRSALAPIAGHSHGVATCALLLIARWGCQAACDGLANRFLRLGAGHLSAAAFTALTML